MVGLDWRKWYSIQHAKSKAFFCRKFPACFALKTGFAGNNFQALRLCLQRKNRRPQLERKTGGNFLPRHSLPGCRICLGRICLLPGKCFFAFFSPSVRPSVRPSGRQLVWASVRLAVWPSGRPSVWPSGRLAVRPSVWASARLGVRLGVCLGVWASEYIKEQRKRARPREWASPF